MQDLVVGQKTFTDVTKPSEIVQLLLNDDQLASLNSSNEMSTKQAGKQTENANGNQMRDLWNEEGDDFFGHTGMAATAEIVEEDKDIAAPTPPVAVVKKRKGATGAPRGRRPGSKNKPKNNTVVASGTPASEGLPPS